MRLCRAETVILTKRKVGAIIPLWIGRLKDARVRSSIGIPDGYRYEFRGDPL